MQEQFAFMEENIPLRRLPDRVFFTFFLGGMAKALVEKIGNYIKSLYGISAQLRPPDHLHVSLQHVGDFPRLKSKYIWAACRAAEAVSSKPFTVSLDRALSFTGRPGRYPCVLCGGENPATFELHQRLAVAMRKYGLKAGFEFNPHMTLFYAPISVPLCPIKPISFEVDEFFLIHSKLGQTKYETLGRWPLRG
ncbi:2'-5' RNA ligase [Mesorhizobium sp. CGMCC 1.15528]|uniref:2'-5' RNA ligase n=1 Tax=Mesorhizobium zhangyense TaxID=1776730 RepID=A0A7C9V7C4_9HYPH|nr:2'-5' RNA ligase family protein [Mesorhizobium zhangyense]NGN40426.1 2'-5' RNA ligase [Mesorhizobium zhangyense]